MAFLADVLRPVLDAFAPHDRRKALGRVRWLFLAFAVLALLVPASDRMGTGDETSRWVQTGALLLVVAAAWIEKWRNAPGFATAAAGLVLGGVVHWVSGQAWGWVAGGTAAAMVGAVQLRRRFDRLPPPPPGHPDDPVTLSGLPRLLHGAALMIGIALLIRVFAFEAVFVPTGSMQPTIMGRRGAVEGDKLIVERTAYEFGAPDRWDIAVFRYPLYEDLNFVKRVVGLPGERVEIRDGDIWVDGAVVAKPPLVQESLWHEVFPTSETSNKRRKLANAFTLSEDDGWRRDGDDGVKLAPRDGRPAFAIYRGRRRGLSVPDQRISFTAEPEPGALVYATITSRGVVTTLAVRAAGGDDETGGVLRVAARDETALAAIPAGRWRVSLAVVDGEAYATVNGRELARLDAPVVGSRGRSASFGGADAGIRFRDLLVEEDVYYRRDGRTAWDVPADSYVVLGDNSERSQDSRHWSYSEIRVEASAAAGSGVPVEDDGTCVFRAQPSLPTETGGRETNLRREGDDTVFQDVQGISRSFPASEVRKITHQIPAPFVHRRLLVGRATLVFWPWTVYEAGFRPRILW